MSIRSEADVGWEELLRQTGLTAHDYMSYALRQLPEVLSAHANMTEEEALRYVLDHPELLCAFIQACASDYHAATLNKIAARMMLQMEELCSTG